MRKPFTVMLAMLTIITLGGCSDRQADDPNENTNLYYKEFITKDGRHIPCAAITGGHGYAGLSCDWEHPTTSEGTK